MRGLALNIMLAVVWALFSGEVSTRELAVGFLLGFALQLVFPDALGTRSYVSRSLGLLRFLGFFLRELTVANVQVALFAMLGVWRGFFWGKSGVTAPDAPLPPVPVTTPAQRLPAYAASALVAGLALFAGPLFSHAEATARELRDNARYIRGVLGERPVVIPAAPTGSEIQKKQEPGEAP